tara:strand:- start:24545 stop:24880 length:336 start_codon:yes stop_codon:yes gene_type:complete
MTEVTFTRNQCPDVKRIQLDTSDADAATQVNIPHFVGKVTIRPEGGKIRMALATSSDDIHTDYIKLSGDTPSEFNWGGGKGVDGDPVEALYLANRAGANSTYVSVFIEGGD